MLAPSSPSLGQTALLSLGGGRRVAIVGTNSSRMASSDLLCAPQRDLLLPRASQATKGRQARVNRLAEMTKTGGSCLVLTRGGRHPRERAGTAFDDVNAASDILLYSSRIRPSRPLWTSS